MNFYDRHIASGLDRRSIGITTFRTFTMQYKTSVHPLWFTVVISNLVLLLTPGFVLANRIGQLPADSSPQMSAARNFPPLPEQLQQPNAILAPQHSNLQIELVNDTNAEVVFQLVGDTEVRTLAANASTILRGLNQPTTLTFQRSDGGFVVAEVAEQEEIGQLRLVLDETANLDDSSISLNVDPNGNVFLN
ncbi:MAG: hypothetical protein AAF268_06445 [Cyanobacteria bacterium P01_A01_bin.3]